MDSDTRRSLKFGAAIAAGILLAGLIWFVWLKLESTNSCQLHKGEPNLDHADTPAKLSLAGYVLARAKFVIQMLDDEDQKQYFVMAINSFDINIYNNNYIVIMKDNCGTVETSFTFYYGKIYLDELTLTKSFGNESIPVCSFYFNGNIYWPTWQHLSCEQPLELSCMKSASNVGRFKVIMLTFQIELDHNSTTRSTFETLPDSASCNNFGSKL